MYEQSMTKRVKLILFRMDVIPATRPSWSSDLYMVKLDRIHVVAVLMQPCCTCRCCYLGVALLSHQLRGYLLVHFRQ
jgi:hypothetical protein